MTAWPAAGSTHGARPRASPTAERAVPALGQLATRLGSVGSSVRALTHALEAFASVVSSAEDRA